ncbi:hypothetical protein NJI34_43680 [Pseudomonas sp. S 311-6]|uniref:Uncharacterized protein n=1 Tax=Kerstersia gyiorum TaxID=206506 RepID=A0A171KSJ3_9BURK|nr:hypothetical protein [Kerstersia gyiorum]MCO7643665.1 hypothetical protein [Pseudomonas sp. S 311-6]KKO71860.1 hypothetical protein AAV32_09850 [Kerstersia gyiorum]MCP1633056.1 hypothetical protein [Kerstersia gyiorum]MCP1636496.1 hypothetical protein [Kerstersia gyiorum]MCP1670251.1 hypothetical protein [Kerstersia gyiorum]
MSPPQNAILVFENKFAAAVFFVDQKEITNGDFFTIAQGDNQVGSGRLQASNLLRADRYFHHAGLSQANVAQRNFLCAAIHFAKN